MIGRAQRFPPHASASRSPWLACLLALAGRRARFDGGRPLESLIHLHDKLEGRATLYAEQLRPAADGPSLRSGDAAAAREIFRFLQARHRCRGNRRIRRQRPGDRRRRPIIPIICRQGGTPNTFGQDLFAVTAGIAAKQGKTGQLYVSLSNERIRRSQHEMMWIAGGTAAVALSIAPGAGDPHRQAPEPAVCRESSMWPPSIAPRRFSTRPGDRGTVPATKSACLAGPRG